MRRLLFTMAIVFLIGCKDDKAIEEASCYPDCFEGPVSSHTGIGCGSIFLSAELDPNTLVSISLSEQNLGINTRCKTFNIVDFSDDIQVLYYTHANHPDSTYFNFCNDIVYSEDFFGEKTTYQAIGGTVTVAVSRDRSYRDDCESFMTSVKLENVSFQKENSTEEVTLDRLTIRDKTVGYCIP